MKLADHKLLLLVVTSAFSTAGLLALQAR